MKANGGQTEGILRKRDVRGQAAACWAQMHGITMPAIDGLLLPECRHARMHCAWVLQHSDSVFRGFRIYVRANRWNFEAVRYATGRAVVRTFTRMALPSGRRDHFCVLTLGFQLAASFAGAHR
jgi:hypothetical protein